MQSFQPIDKISSSLEETWCIAADLARCLAPGDVVGFIGELGAGKTSFVQGLAAALGVNTNEERVLSPTFTIFKIYETGRLPLYHFDLYRIASLSELEAIGYEEFWWGQGITLVEWFDRVSCPPLCNFFLVEMSHVGENRRGITIKWNPANLK